MHPTAVLLALPLLLALPAWAQSVGLAGMLGGRALVIVDGAAPKTLGAGESYRGVKVISTRGDVAVLEVDGQRFSMRVGDAPASVGDTAAAANGQRVVLMADANGHFAMPGLINGKPVKLLVDTGASALVLSEADAKRIGLDYRNGRTARVRTANGQINAWWATLDSVRLGDVTVYGVPCLVSEPDMPFVLLGNTFLSRFQMTRSNDQMVLEKRF